MMARMSAQGTPPVQPIQCHHNGITTAARNLKLLKRTITSFEKSSATISSLSGTKQLRKDTVATTRVIECQVQEALFSIVKVSTMQLTH
jgi:hypothetical protein